MEHRVTKGEAVAIPYFFVLFRSNGNGLDLLLIFWEGALRAPSQKINNRFETPPGQL
jgi:hypothetical protein